MATTTEAGEGSGDGDEPASAFRDPAWWAGLLKAGFGRGFVGFLAFAVVTGTACYLVIGEAAFLDALGSDIGLIVRTAPRIVAALAAAGFLWVLLPRERMTALIGTESGVLGLLIASAAGMITPGGPTSAFALLAVLAASGADRGGLVAYITAWAILGLQRALVWDVPFMGAEFALARFLIGLPLPIIAGLIARRLPLTLNVATTESAERR